MRRHWPILVVLALVIVIVVLVTHDSADTRPSTASPRPERQRDETSATAPVLPRAPEPSSKGTTVVHSKWGSGPTELGRRIGEESNPEGPMAMVATPTGLVVLDQVNARIMRYGLDGTPLGSFPIAPDTAQDIAVGSDGRVAVLDRVTDAHLLYYDSAGQLVGQAPVVGGPITESGGATGVFIAQGVYIEREHGEVVRVLGLDGQPDPARRTLPGRPLRNGAGSVQALIADKAAGLVTVRVYDAKADVVWQRSVRFPISLISLLMLDSDAAGRIYIAAHVATESTAPPHEMTNERTIVWRLAGDTGAPMGALTLPAPPPTDEALRPLSVGDDGTIYQMQPSPSGVDIVAYRFP
jgi:hypothetical protein